MTRFNKKIARLLVVSMLGVGLPVPPAAHAEMITTAQIAASQPGQISPARARVEAFLERADVRAELERRGVNPADARKRVEALSDDEVQRISGKIDSLPAGGDVVDVLWIAFFVFLILLITDILGFTKVFSFTRPAK